MDRLWTEYRYEALRAMQKPAHIRRSALQKRPGQMAVAEFVRVRPHHGWVVRSAGRAERHQFRALCGINLGYQMRPKQILLFGFDMKRGPNGEPTGIRPIRGAQGRDLAGKYADWSKQSGQRHPPVRRGRH
jgi:hypothetical protein